MMLNKILPGATLLLLLVCAISGHTNEEIENELLSLHDQIEKYSSYSSEYSEDRDEKLNEANKAFRESLMTLASQHESTLTYGFPRLTEKIQIETSPDGRLRVYSWDTLSGGTMHFYDTVFQFRGVDGVYSAGSFYDEGDPGGFVTDVFNIETKTGTVYLVATTSRISTSDNGQSIGALQIDGNTLSDGVKIFKTSSGTTSSIGFSYDFFSVADRDERPVRLFRYEPKTKTLRFPVVIADDGSPQGRVTDKDIVYRYDGKYFVRIVKR